MGLPVQISRRVPDFRSGGQEPGQKPGGENGFSLRVFCYNTCSWRQPEGMDTRRIKVLHLLATMPVGVAEDLVAAVVKGLDPARFAGACACIGPPGPVGEELAAAGYPG